MLRGLTRAGIGEIGSGEQFIRKAAEYSFQAVDLDPLELMREYGLEGSRQLLEKNGVQIGVFPLPVEWRSTDEDFRTGVRSLIEISQAALELGCDKAMTYILPSTDLDSASFMATATRRIKIIADILGAFEIRLGLEFVGPHHLRKQWKNPFIWGLKETLEWIRTISSPNVGVVLDSYHWYTNGLGINDILELGPEQILHVHINDARDLPIEQVQDFDRIYPGEGVINLTGFLSALREIGYRGVVAQEVLTVEPPKQSPDELLQRSKIGFDKVFQGL